MIEKLCPDETSCPPQSEPALEPYPIRNVYINFPSTVFTEEKPPSNWLARQNRLADYSRLDFGINYRPTLKRLPFKVEFNLSILNLLNRTNLFSKDFYLADLEDSDGIPEWYDIEKRLLKRTPQLVVRLYW